MKCDNKSNVLKCKSTPNLTCLEDDKVSIGSLFGKTACTKWPDGIQCLKTDNKGNETELDKNKNLYGKKNVTKCVEWNTIDSIEEEKPSLFKKIKNAVVSKPPESFCTTKKKFCLSTKDLLGKEPKCLEDDKSAVGFGRTACIKWPDNITCFKTDNKGKEIKKDTFGNFIGEKGMKCIEWTSPETNFVNEDEVVKKLNQLKFKYSNLKAINSFEGKCNTDELVINTIININNVNYYVCVKLQSKKK